jgi:glycosyltransferase involved in cell wall biosynthesis
VPVALDQGSLLLTASAEAAKAWLGEQKIHLPKLTMIPFAADDDYQPLAWTEKENIKVKYAGGKEFFVTRSYFAEEQLLMLLKAFSLFKKRQQSNIQLLIISMDGDKDHSPVEKLENYKYRNDVHLYPGLTEEEFIQINASAYAFLQPVKDFDGNGLLNAFQAQVPVISTVSEREEETTGTALLFATYNDHEQMADQMMTLFKDENLRNELVRKGKIKAREFSMQQAARLVWKGMMQAIDINPNN